ncbi:MAG: hypothetical protein ACXWL2_03890 [Candidatus Chromulinivorax sp.]
MKNNIVMIGILEILWSSFFLLSSNSDFVEISLDQPSKPQLSTQIKSDQIYEKKALDVIDKAFYQLETWVGDSFFVDSQKSIEQATKYMNDAIDAVGYKIGSLSAVQNVKITVNKAITALVPTGVSKTFNKPAFLQIIDVVKSALRIPVIISFKIAGGVSGGAVGFSSGFVATLSKSVRFAQFINEKNLSFTTVSDALVSITKLIPLLVIEACGTVVASSTIALYAAAQGINIGQQVGGNVALKLTGADRPSNMDLYKQEQVKNHLDDFIDPVEEDNGMFNNVKSNPISSNFHEVTEHQALFDFINPDYGSLPSSPNNSGASTPVNRSRSRSLDSTDSMIEGNWLVSHYNNSSFNHSETKSLKKSIINQDFFR